ncbi:MAG: non-canonical purine NTP diphosphatase [Bacteroidales bacterium]|nr:non-canonical purine NTP diphosphatase [Bacteroidales bacterium]MBN2821383.1 non-canonical purine NTP diphosphatase [Bacteroidales bacterium]
MKLIFATNNKHKLEEIKDLLNGKYMVQGLSEVGINDEIPETHETLEENAIEKAEYIFTKYGFNCFADDTGLEIDALDGRPGVYSARYAGTNCSFDDNVNKILEELGQEQNRKARFRTVIAMIRDGKLKTFEGTVEGEITLIKSGTKGFGYDPVFMPTGYNQTFAEMTLSIKNKISHRAKALEKFIDYLNSTAE